MNRRSFFKTVVAAVAVRSPGKWAFPTAGIDVQRNALIMSLASGIGATYEAIAADFRSVDYSRWRARL